MGDVFVTPIFDFVVREVVSLEGHYNDAVHVPRSSLLPFSDGAASDEQLSHDVRVERVPAFLEVLVLGAIVRRGDRELEAPGQSVFLDHSGEVELKGVGGPPMMALYALIT